MAWEYFRAENHGLVPVYDVDWLRGTGCYEWENTTVLYHPETDRFYWEHGSGCSCNGPLDDVSTIDDLKSGSFWDLVTDVQSYLSERYGEGTYSRTEGGGAEAYTQLTAQIGNLIEAAQRVRTNS
jgi:hypothetical protein